jgi:hypothetical protein
MLNNKYIYEGLDPSRRVLVVDDLELRGLEMYAPELLGSAYSLSMIGGSVPSAVAGAACLEFRCKELARLPTWLRSCHNLRFLAWPSGLAGFLSSEFLPDGLITLEITGEGKTSLDGFAHQNIERIVAPNVQVMFSPVAFPALCHFHAKSDRKYQLFRDLNLSGVDLLSATLSPYSSKESLLAVPSRKLAYLRLVGGKGDSLDGISRFQLLTDLDIHDLPKLENLIELKQLPLLENISIGYCRKIGNVASLANLETLRRIFIYGSGDLLTTAEKQLFLERQIELFGV